MHNGGNEAPERSALNDDQVNILMDAIKDCPPYLFCMIGLYAGLRTEEILGLKWDCVHLDEPPHIDVRESFPIQGQQAGGYGSPEVQSGQTDDSNSQPTRRLPEG